VTDAVIREKIGRFAANRGADSWLCYVTSDKEPNELFAGNIAPDVLGIIHEQLSKTGKKDKLLLFLNTNGGSLDAPWPIVSLLREYCSQLEVAVPNKALSAGTLISLGADKILMTASSFLSPIDPQGVFMIGQQPKSIQVEDVNGYINFVKDKVGASDQQSLSTALQLLSGEIPPSVLGSIYRSHFLIRSLAKKLLNLHRDKADKNQVDLIVENLSEKLFSHSHLISRLEARDEIGFKDIIVFLENSHAKLAWQIIDGFKKNMKTAELFEPISFLGSSESKSLELQRACILGMDYSYGYYTDYEISKNPLGSPQPINIVQKQKGWLKKES
jgi:hypothetical protein